MMECSFLPSFLPHNGPRSTFQKCGSDHMTWPVWLPPSTEVSPTPSLTFTALHKLAPVCLPLLPYVPDKLTYFFSKHNCIFCLYQTLAHTVPSFWNAFPPSHSQSTCQSPTFLVRDPAPMSTVTLSLFCQPLKNQTVPRSSTAVLWNVLILSWMTSSFRLISQLNYKQLIAPSFVKLRWLHMYRKTNNYIYDF